MKKHLAEVSNPAFNTKGRTLGLSIKYLTEEGDYYEQNY
jgi:hypothetical protein